MERFVISGQAAADVNAYLEYNLIVGDKDGGKLLPQGEYKKLREDFIDQTSKQTNFIVHKQTKQKKLFGITDGEENDSQSGMISIHNKHPDFTPNQRGFVDISKSEQDSIYNLYNKPVDFNEMQSTGVKEDEPFEDYEIPQKKTTMSSLSKAKVSALSAPKNPVVAKSAASSSLIPKTNSISAVKPTSSNVTKNTSSQPKPTLAKKTSIGSGISKPTATTTTTSTGLPKNSVLSQKKPIK